MLISPLFATACCKDKVGIEEAVWINLLTFTQSQQTVDAVCLQMSISPVAQKLV